MSRDLIEFACSVEAGEWGDEALVETAVAGVLPVAAAYLHARESQPFPNAPVEVSLLFTDDAAMAEINGEWRGKPAPTNVLSFPAFPVTPGAMPGPMLGDIVLARETIEREAAEIGKPVEAHVAHLLVHGFLHLFGYDHVETADAEKMEGLETRILAELGLSDPYGELEPDRQDR
jgi:probable rRNA maturation factor